MRATSVASLEWLATCATRVVASRLDMLWQQPLVQYVNTGCGVGLQPHLQSGAGQAQRASPLTGPHAAHRAHRGPTHRLPCVPAAAVVHVSWYAWVCS